MRPSNSVPQDRPAVIVQEAGFQTLQMQGFGVWRRRVAPAGPMGKDAAQSKPQPAGFYSLLERETGLESEPGL